MSREKIPIDKIKQVLEDKITKNTDMLSKKEFQRFEIRTKSFDPLLWLKIQPQNEKIYFKARGEEEPSNAVVGSILKITSSENGKLNLSFKDVEYILESGAKFFGGISFSGKKPKEDKWKSFGAYNFIIPRFEYIHTERDAFFVMNYRLSELASGKTQKIINEINGINFSIEKRSENTIKSYVKKYLPDKKGWIKQISSYLEKIRSGNIEKIVAARRLELKVSEGIDPYDIVFKLKNIGDNAACFLIGFNNKDFFLGLTPERLFRRENKLLKTESVAGTINRGKNSIEDKILGKKLFSSAKNTLEHDFVTKYIVENLDNLCESVTVSKRVLLKLSSLQHLCRKISGNLKDNISDGDILEKMSPTPAVSGMPQKESMNILKKEESFERGWYTGVVGFAGKNISDYYVGIRSALVSEDKIYVYSGAGIVERSVPEKEWDEINLKSSKYKKILNYED